MQQFIADQIEQMDLALDQLAMRDRNYDRFALLLIDNVVELTLHEHAKAKDFDNQLRRKVDKPKHDPKLVGAALGPHFESKVRLARTTAMVSTAVADSIQLLHSFRNTAHHRGLRHEGILHSLAVFYFQNACNVLKGFSPPFWSSGSRDQISHRAIKYLGKASLLDGRAVFLNACVRLEEVGLSLGDALVPSLYADIERTVDRVDHQLDFLATDSPVPMSRQQAVIDAQSWPFAFADEGKRWARENNCAEKSIGGYVAWLAKNYPWPVKSDPIPSWTKRLRLLELEADKHLALKKYCDFMKQTEDIREKIGESTSKLDGYIQQQIDLARGK